MTKSKTLSLALALVASTLCSCSGGGLDASWQGDAVTVSSGGRHTCALDSSGAVWCWGDADAFLRGAYVTGADAHCLPPYTPVLSGEGFCESSVPHKVDIGSRTYVDLAVGATYGAICGLTGDGDVDCWPGLRAGCEGDLGTCDEIVRVSGGKQFSSIAVGELRWCGVEKDGTGWCWDGDIHAGSSDLTLQEIPGGHRWKMLSVGGAEGGGLADTCGIDTDGGAWCWGNAGYTGQGDDGVTSTVPRAVAPGTRFKLVRTGTDVSCALDEAGAAWCWGANIVGEIGNGTAGPALAPATKTAGGDAFVDLDVGIEAACGVTKAGTLKCWGWDTSGQLGLDSPVCPDSLPDRCTTQPTAVPVGDKVAGVAVGNTVTCALGKGGDVFCWGENGNGQAANGAGPKRAVDASP